MKVDWLSVCPVIGRQRAGHVTSHRAVADAYLGHPAGRVRMRPIILTSPGAPGIFSLIFSTVLTLVVVPALYVIFAERLGMKVVWPHHRRVPFRLFVKSRVLSTAVSRVEVTVRMVFQIIVVTPFWAWAPTRRPASSGGA